MRTYKPSPLGPLAAPATILLLFGVASALAFGQEAVSRRGGRKGPSVKPALVPFFRLNAASEFTVIQADKSKFIEMEALVATLPALTVPGQKKPTTAVYLQYGYKKGGIGVVYQMPKQPGLTADAAFAALLKAGVFRDRQYFKEWTMKSVPDGKLLVAVSGTTREVRDLLIRAIGK